MNEKEVVQKEKSKNKGLVWAWVVIVIVAIAAWATVVIIMAPDDNQDEIELIEPDCNDPRNCGIQAKKPVIYLYPAEETEVSVGLRYDGEVFASFPELGNGWKVRAYPDGRLVSLGDGREYSYLFWEGIPAAEREYDWSKGFVVRGSETREFLQATLAEMGLTPKEYNEFIVYWYPQMEKNEWNLVHFASYDEYDKYAELDVTPAPDSILRVFMVYKTIDEPVEVSPQSFAPFARNGFSLVEWGGSEIK